MKASRCSARVILFISYSFRSWVIVTFKIKPLDVYNEPHGSDIFSIEMYIINAETEIQGINISYAVYLSSR
mgnify:CR=1 FL=1